MSCDASARVLIGVTYCGLHSSAARQDDVESALALAARRDDECTSRPRLAASGRIDGVAVAGLHPSAARHDGARRLRMAAQVPQALQAALDNRRRIDLVVAGSAYSASIDANAKLLYRICHCCHSNLAPGPLQAKRVASEAEHELWIRCVLALFCRLGA